MEKSFDLVVEDTKKELVNVINKSGLPITVSEMVIKDVLGLVRAEAESSLIKQRQEFNKTKEVEQNDTNK